MDPRGNEPPREHTARTAALPLLAAGGAVAAAVLGADLVAYGWWRALVAAVLLAVLLPLVATVPAPAPRPVSARNPARAAVPPPLRYRNALTLLLVPALSPALGFAMGKSCGGCAGAPWAVRVLVVGTALIAAYYGYAQRRRSTPAAALRAAKAVLPAMGLLVAVALSVGSL